MQKGKKLCESQKCLRSRYFYCFSNLALFCDLLFFIYHYLIFLTALICVHFQDNLDEDDDETDTKVNETAGCNIYQLR